VFELPMVNKCLIAQKSCGSVQLLRELSLSHEEKMFTTLIATTQGGGSLVAYN
jgi:hypothetical protein